MAKRKMRKPEHRSAGPRSTWAGGLFLIVVDNVPLREEAAAAYQAIERECGKVSRELERHETKDLPAFSEWEARTFGALLTELREVQAELGSKSQFLGEIQDEMLFGRSSELAAYKRVKYWREHPEEDPAGFPGPGGNPDSFDNFDSAGGSSRDAEDSFHGIFDDGRELPPDFDIDEYDASSAQTKENFRVYYEGLADFFEMFTGEDALPLEAALARERERRHGGNSRHGAHSHGGHGLHASEGAQPVDQRISTLYRRLVRRLHPDHNAGLTARERELWHDLQDAYRARDLARMESIEARVEAGTGGDPSRLSVGALRGLVRDLARALAELQATLRRARQHPAWKFKIDSKKIARLELRERTRITSEIKIAQSRLKRVTEILDSLEARATRPRKPPKKRAPGA